MANITTDTVEIYMYIHTYKKQQQNSLCKKVTSKNQKNQMKGKLSRESIWNSSMSLVGACGLLVEFADTDHKSLFLFILLFLFRFVFEIDFIAEI